MSNNTYLELKKALYAKIEKYFVITSFLDFLLSTIEIDENSDYEKSTWAVFNAYIQGSSSYIMSVFNDLKSEYDNFMPKSSANRILLRNCVEAILILNVLENKPELATPYFATYYSDKERIKNIYINSDEDDEKAENKRFLKRFSWLPRYRGKKAKSMSDLLNYVNFESEYQKNYYKIIIKNFDTFIHPSFNFARSLNNNLLGGSIAGVYAMFIDHGIFQESVTNLLSSFKSIYQNHFKESVFEILDALLDSGPYNSTPLPIKAEELLDVNFNNENKTAVLSSVYSTFNINKYYQKITTKSPSYLESVSSIIGICANYLTKYTRTSYRIKNIAYLLQDLTPRYDDMLHSVYENNPMQFYAQSRYIIESLSIINVLMLEDEERSKMYAIHQRIKGYDAKISAVDFINSSNEEIKAGTTNTAINEQYFKDIDIIHNYYLKDFDKDVDEKNILRLNGWALYLKYKNNDTVPNSPFFVAWLCECFYQQNYEEVSSLLLGLFEESNAFTYVTPYGFNHNKESFNLEKPLLLINDLSARLIYSLFKNFEVEKLLNEEEKKNVQNGFFNALEAIKKQISDTNK
jgi:hypothetical protein